MAKDNRTGKEKATDILAIIEFVALLLFYFTSMALASFVSRDPGGITVLGTEIRTATFTGVISSVGNICMIFMVVLFDKAGFITALLILLGQFPVIIINMLRTSNYSSIPGLFVNFFTIIAIVIIYSRNKSIKKYQQTEVEHIKAQQLLSERLFMQTATALVNAIDAKDTYSHGHSIRVAEYSEKIARRMGKSDEEIEKIYYAALLHDVGKIGIADQIINKNGRLTPEEYDVIKQHPVMGYQILSGISEYPYLSIGAHFHHERYDGRGYPDGLKAEDIPELARIISVADSYDAMTSTRSYREALPQPLVREEMVKGSGSQFDPEIARIMIGMIDEDHEYRLREKRAIREFSWKSGLECAEYRDTVSDSVLVTPYMTTLRMRFTPDDKAYEDTAGAAVILFDASDARYHAPGKASEEMSYFEYATLWLDRRVDNANAREIQSSVEPSGKDTKAGNGVYIIRAAKIKDHVRIDIDNGKEVTVTVIALPDSSRFVYGALTGVHCLIDDTRIEKADKTIDSDYIPRIAPEVSYIEGPEGDLPNMQIDNYRGEHTDGIEVKDGMKLKFHMMTLPTARLVWHCAYIVIFGSADGKVNGPDYHEYAFIRLDGEYWDGGAGEGVRNELIVKNDEFIGWNRWKEENKKGIDCLVGFEYRGKELIVTTQNLGLYVKNTTVFDDGGKKLYAAITGDQCAITDIHII